MSDFHIHKHSGYVEASACLTKTENMRMSVCSRVCSFMCFHLLSAFSMSMAARSLFMCMYLYTHLKILYIYIYINIYRYRYNVERERESGMQTRRADCFALYSCTYTDLCMHVCLCGRTHVVTCIQNIYVHTCETVLYVCVYISSGLPARSPATTAKRYEGLAKGSDHTAKCRPLPGRTI